MGGIYIYPEVIDVLDKIREKYRLCMITNGPPKWQRLKISKLGIAQYFEEIIVSGELGHHKPSPTIFNEMTRRMNVKSNEIIYIGNDYKKDIIGADRVGWITAWISRKNDDIGEIEPTYHIKDLSELKI
jgi:HAD superfamily hydrolase (TIGR01549 family)